MSHAEHVSNNSSDTNLEGSWIVAELNKLRALNVKDEFEVVEASQVPAPRDILDKKEQTKEDESFVKVDKDPEWTTTVNQKWFNKLRHRISCQSGDNTITSQQIKHNAKNSKFETRKEILSDCKGSWKKVQTFSAVCRNDKIHSTAKLEHFTKYGAHYWEKFKVLRERNKRKKIDEPLKQEWKRLAEKLHVFENEYHMFKAFEYAVGEVKFLNR